MSPQHHRLAAVGSAVLLAGSPIVMGTASADEAPPRTGSSMASAALPEELTTAIGSARAEFRSAAVAARLALRTALRGAPTSLESATARAAARASLQTARTVYGAAVSAAVARFAPGVTLPRTVLEPGWWTGMSDVEWLTS
jgi:hypothetical protein